MAIIEQLRRLPKPSTELAAVEITLYPPDARRRDIDNYNKALFDALTHAGVWEDDSQIKRMLVEWGPVAPKGRVEITISRYEPAVRRPIWSKSMSQLIVNGVVTMSSRDIADLVQSKHSDVKRPAERLVAAGILTAPLAQFDFEHNGNVYRSIVLTNATLW